MLFALIPNRKMQKRNYLRREWRLGNSNLSRKLEQPAALMRVMPFSCLKKQDTAPSLSRSPLILVFVRLAISILNQYQAYCYFSLKLCNLTFIFQYIFFH